MKSRTVDLKIGWVVWNVALLVPVLVPLAIGRSVPEFMRGFLSYCYALTAVAYYLFDQHQKVTTELVRLPSTRKAVSILFMFVIIAMIALYDPAKLSVSSLTLVIGAMLIFVISMVLAYYLSTPLLKRQEVEEEERDRQLDELLNRQRTTRSDARKDAEEVMGESEQGAASGRSAARNGARKDARAVMEESDEDKDH